MYQLKIRNAEFEDDYQVYDLSEEEWLHWKEILVKANVCDPQAFEGHSKRLVITYYPGTLPAQEEEDDDILNVI